MAVGPRRLAARPRQRHRPRGRGGPPGPDRPGRIVVTSRTTDAWYGIGRVVTLPVLPAAEAVELFTRVATHAGPRDTTGAERLCETLGQLPLAVEIAAAYCGRTATPPLAYLAELGRSGGPGNAEEAVARTLRVTLDRLDASNPLAGAVLGLLAWFAPDRIPALLLPSMPGVREALGELAAHSMVTLHEDGSVSVHRLVQAVARRADPEDPYRAPRVIAQARLVAEGALGRAVPLNSGDPVHWETWRGLMPHIESFLRYADPAEDGKALLVTLAVAGAYLSLNGLPEAAVGMYERALTGSERLLGPDDPFTLGMRGALAECLASSGRPEEAIERAAELVRRTTEVLGADHRDTLLTRASLAQAHLHAGLLREAATLQASVLEDMVRVLGVKCRETLVAFVDLAGMYQAAHRTREAVAVCAYATAELRTLLGEEHLEALSARINLAGVYASAGVTDRARADYRELLPVCVRVLGEHHPYTVLVEDALAELPE